MLLIITSTGDRLFGFINIDDLERPWTLKMLILSDFLAIFGCKRVNCDEMDGDRLRLPANRNCYRLSRVSWALLKFLVPFPCAYLDCLRSEAHCLNVRDGDDLQSCLYVGQGQRPSCYSVEPKTATFVRCERNERLPAGKAGTWTPAVRSNGGPGNHLRPADDRATVTRRLQW